MATVTLFIFETRRQVIFIVYFLKAYRPYDLSLLQDTVFSNILKVYRFKVNLFSLLIPGEKDKPRIAPVIGLLSHVCEDARKWKAWRLGNPTGI